MSKPEKTWELIVDGYSFSGWTRLEVTRRLEELADSFRVDYFNQWPEQKEPIPISAGAYCFLRYKGDPIITGYVDEARVEYSADGQTLSVSGRSSTGDLVDCSAVKGQWKNQPITAIASALCNPFDIEANLDSSADQGAVFKWFRVQEGETVFDALERAARMRGLILRSDADGNLVLTRSS